MRQTASDGVATAEPDDHCAATYTSGLVVRIYGSASRCRRIVAHALATPNGDVSVLASNIVGSKAVVRLTVKNNNQDVVAGSVNLRYERAAWRIDDFDADYLRADLGSTVVDQAGVTDGATSDDGDTCLTRAFAHTPAARLKRIAFGVLGRRHPALLAVYGQLAKCRMNGISILRNIFESDMTEELQPDYKPASDHLKCVLRGLRFLVSDAIVGDVLAYGGVQGRLAEQKVYPKLLGAATACAAPKPHPLTPV